MVCSRPLVEHIGARLVRRQCLKTGAGDGFRVVELSCNSAPLEEIGVSVTRWSVAEQSELRSSIESTHVMGQLRVVQVVPNRLGLKQDNCSVAIKKQGFGR